MGRAKLDRVLLAAAASSGGFWKGGKKKVGGGCGETRSKALAVGEGTIRLVGEHERGGEVLHMLFL